MFVGMILIDIVCVPGIPIWASCILLVLSVTAVFMKAPVESEKKPLGQGELRKYKKLARLICIIEICIIVTGVALVAQQIYLYYAIAGMATTEILLIMSAQNSKITSRTVTRDRSAIKNNKKI